jgi:MoaA/NifB/PqqE/SkfB family radical SAM enzyme
LNLEQLKRWLIIQKEYLTDIQLVISGGEPTIVRQYTELLSWLSSYSFATPILYTNGLNIKDLMYVNNPKKKVKIILTHHQTSDVNQTRDYVRFLNDLEISFIVKVLVDKPTEILDFGDCKVVVEGIRKLYSKDPDTKLKQIQEYPMALDGSSPYKWRWNGYRDFIKWEWTAWKETFVFTVDPTGNVFNCHFFNEPPIGSIYDTEEIIQDKNIQIAWCYPFKNGIAEDTKTRCEIQHYVNLFEEA